MYLEAYLQKRVHTDVLKKELYCSKFATKKLDLHV